MEQQPTFCDQCGRPGAAGDHGRCVERARYEPPRYCGRCGRRMVVQVTPSRWTARCVEHGQRSG